MTFVYMNGAILGWFKVKKINTNGAICFFIHTLINNTNFLFYIDDCACLDVFKCLIDLIVT